MKDYFFSKYFPVSCHTENVRKNGVFFAMQGMKENGIYHVPKALEKGAKTIMVQKNSKIPQKILEKIDQYGAKLKVVTNARLALAKESANALNYPANKLKIIAVTGTKGKTSTVFFIEQILKQTGLKTAIVSTVGNSILKQKFPASLTTPQPDYLHVFFDLCVNIGIEWVIMEVSAQAATMKRIAHITFDVIVFTNFSPEHGEFYNKVEDYFKAKKSIISQIKPNGLLVLNGDNPKIKSIAKNHKNIARFSRKNNNLEKVFENISKNHNILKYKILESYLTGIKLKITYKSNEHIIEAPLSGGFNAENIAASLLVAKHLNINFNSSCKALKSFKSVPGRMNRYKLPNGAVAIVDYAHNPSSFKAVFSSLKPLTNNLITIFGAGGERCAKKRPEMGKIASDYSNFLIITTDNPRSEDPNKIALDVFNGIPENSRKKVAVELDREKAISLAYKKSSKDSIIILLAKGAETYQILRGFKFYFSEKDVIENLGGKSF